MPFKCEMLLSYSLMFRNLADILLEPCFQGLSKEKLFLFFIRTLGGCKHDELWVAALELGAYHRHIFEICSAKKIFKKISIFYKCYRVYPKLLIYMLAPHMKDLSPPFWRQRYGIIFTPWKEVTSMFSDDAMVTHQYDRKNDNR